MSTRNILQPCAGLPRVSRRVRATRRDGLVTVLAIIFGFPVLLKGQVEGTKPPSACVHSWACKDGLTVLSLLREERSRPRFRLTIQLQVVGPVRRGISESFPLQRPTAAMEGEASVVDGRHFPNLRHLHNRHPSTGYATKFESPARIEVVHLSVLNMIFFRTGHSDEIENFVSGRSFGDIVSYSFFWTGNARRKQVPCR